MVDSSLPQQPIQHPALAHMRDPALIGVFDDEAVALFGGGERGGDMRVALTDFEDEHAVGFEGGEPVLRDAHFINAPGGAADEAGMALQEVAENGFFRGRVEAAQETAAFTGVGGALFGGGQHIRRAVARTQHGDLLALQERGIADHAEGLAVVRGMLHQLPWIHADVFGDAFCCLGRAHDHFVIIAVPDADGFGW